MLWIKVFQVNQEHTIDSTPMQILDLLLFSNSSWESEIFLIWVWVFPDLEFSDYSDVEREYDT